MTDSKLLDIVEDIKNLSTSGNVIKVEEYKKGKKVEKQRGPKQRKSADAKTVQDMPRLGISKKKKLPIYVITNGSTNGYKIILTKPKNNKKNKNYSNQ